MTYQYGQGFEKDLKSFLKVIKNENSIDFDADYVTTEIKEECEYLFDFDSIEIVTQKTQYSQNPCTFDECPFKAIEGKEFCDVHQKEFENTLADRQPDEDE